MEQTRCVVLKHLSGSKVGEVESFPLASGGELSIGRDPSAVVRFDPEKDDLVGRQHAKIAPDTTDPAHFTITDLSSRNGTHVNKKRIFGTTRIKPGDVIQFGPGGPEVVFDLDPRPDSYVPETRELSGLFGGYSVAPKTREAASQSGAASLSALSASSPGQANGHHPSSTSLPGADGRAEQRPIGKRTVERLIASHLTRAKSESRSYFALGAVALVAVMVLAAGWLVYQNRNVAAALSEGLKKAEAESKAVVAGVKTKTEAMVAPNWAAVTQKYNDAVVKIEVGWHLIDSHNKGVLYHQLEEVPGQEGKFLPLFIEWINGNEKFIEPWTTTDPKNKQHRDNIPIGSNHSGSGFVVDKEGYILTNRHVAATWEMPYQWPTEDPRYRHGGLVLVMVKDPVADRYVPRTSKVISPDEFPDKWVPTKSRSRGGKPLEGKIVEGEFEYLDVAFANDRLRRRARLILASDRHDVALIKVDVAGQALKAVELNDTESVQKQDPVLVMGYPAVTPRRVGVTSSAQGFVGSGPERATISDPTTTSGAVQNILRDQASSEQTVFSLFGDLYQLQINATGAGNSGGPVFDDQGRVIAIFSAGWAKGGATVTFAVPIRYGIELLRPNQSASR